MTGSHITGGHLTITPPPQPQSIPNMRAELSGLIFQALHVTVAHGHTDTPQSRHDTHTNPVITLTANGPDLNSLNGELTLTLHWNGSTQPATLTVNITLDINCQNGHHHQQTTTIDMTSQGGPNHSSTAHLHNRVNVRLRYVRKPFLVRHT